jgi:hypothetical protein
VTIRTHHRQLLRVNGNCLIDSSAQKGCVLQVKIEDAILLRLEKVK